MHVSVYNFISGRLDLEVECRRLISRAHCVWSRNVNNHDQLIHFSCGANGYLNGVESHHNDRQENRVWSFKCCSYPHYITLDCHI